MLDAICNLIARIVFSGIDGRILIVPLIILMHVIIGQAKELKKEIKNIYKEGEVK